jgi:protein phosphatase
VLVLAVVGGATYGGYRWTQTQYFVGTKDDHVALYRGISQDLAWVSLSKVEKDHPEIELKYLPDYQRKQVEETIAGGNRAKAQDKIQELATQASACKKQEQRRKAADQVPAAPPGEGQAGGTTGLPTEPTPKPSTSTAATPTPGPTLSEEEQKLASNCGKQ